MDDALIRVREVALENVPILGFLPPEQKDQVARLFRPLSFNFGDVVIAKGSPADAFYVIISGRLRVVKHGPGGEEITLNVLKAGDAFGEGALLDGAGVHQASVRCSAKTELLALGAGDFHALLAEAPLLRAGLELLRKHRALHNFLREFSRLGNLPLPVIRSLLERLEEVSYPRKTMLFDVGDPAGPLYVIRQGKVRIYVSESGRERNLAFLRAGDYFGERSILHKSRRSAAAVTLTDCQLLALSPEAVTALMAEHPELRAAMEERSAMYNADKVARLPLDFADEILPATAEWSNRVDVSEVPQEPDQRVADELSDVPWGDPFCRPSSRILRMPFVQQIDEMDCGAAALAMICRHFGRKVPLAFIRQLVHTSTDGTSLRGLCTAAKELGLAAKAAKVSHRNLDRMPLPAIAHWEGNHWVVLYDIQNRWIRFADPAAGQRRISRNEFEGKWSGYVALCAPTERFSSAPEETRTSLTWLWALLLPYRKLFAKLLLLAVIAAVTSMILPVFTQIIVDKVVGESKPGLLYTLGLAMLAAIVCMTGSSLFQRYLASAASVEIDAAVLDHLTQAMLGLPMTYFATRRTGDIQRRLAGAREVRQFLVESCVEGVLDAAQIVVVLGCMAWYSPPLTGLFLLTVPAYLALMFYSSLVLKPVFMLLEDSFGKYSSRQIDAIKGIEAVKAAGAEESLREHMLGEFKSLAKQQFRATFLALTYDSTLRFVTLLAQALFLYFGAHQVLRGDLSLGRFVAFNALVAMAYAPLLGLLGLWDEVQRSSVLLNRISDVLDHEPEQGRQKTGLMSVRTLEGHVQLHNVGFRYGGPDRPFIVRNITLDVPPGRTIAIVGRSGSGKTTLMKCLCGLLEPTEGTIHFDGIDMQTLRFRELRRQIGMVLQENHIFDDTIARNIALGELSPAPDRVVWAARAADAHEFISRLPLGYETRVGETGLALSGGQRQRIAIARALYWNPPVLILDEATSSLDTESEKAIQENVFRIFSGRTTFVVAHRLSTVRNSDLIVVLDRGRIIELGNHDELMAKRGLYFYLSSQQIGL